MLNFFRSSPKTHARLLCPINVNKVKCLIEKLGFNSVFNNGVTQFLYHFNQSIVINTLVILKPDSEGTLLNIYNR